MPKLVANIGIMPRQLALDQIEVACTLEDELRYSSFVGQKVVLAHQIVADGALVAFASATLEHFDSYGIATKAVFRNIEMLAAESELAGVPPASVFSLLGDGYLQVAAGTDSEVDELVVSRFVIQDVLGRIAGQVRDNVQAVCAFSGIPVKPGEGTATPIRPADMGGQVHVRNFLFLHDEPAHLFNRFAWTVGPDLEIIADTWLVGSEVLSTVNPGGKLLLGKDPHFRPDERALAWHRQKFLDRLR